MCKCKKKNKKNCDPVAIRLAYLIKITRSGSTCEAAQPRGPYYTPAELLTQLQIRIDSPLPSASKANEQVTMEG